MSSTSETPGRRSVRLKDYDYAGAGAYFVTICTQSHALLFGAIVGEEMRLSPAGEIVRDEWARTADVRPDVELDAFVVMPNHLHGIIVITGHPSPTVGATRRVAPTENRGTARGPVPGSVGAMVGQFKSVATRRIRQCLGAPSLTVWQRNYYEHVIRDEESLNLIRQYIADNPAGWALDRENPAAIAPTT